LKSPHLGREAETCRADIAKEAEIYRRLGLHDRLVPFIGHSYERGLVLAHMQNGDLKEYLKGHPARDIPMEQRFVWTRQTAEATQSFTRQWGHPL
jgi:light-regulated signal transduction histidine kinase (bacteriophytochrome)